MNTSIMKVSIRKAKIEDAQQIARVHVKSWQESYQGIISDDYLKNIPFEERLKLRKSLLEKNGSKSLHLVASIQNQIVGFCDVGLSESYSDYHGELYAIYLLNAFKHQGIGSKLMKHVFDHSMKYQLYPLVAWVLKDNLQARQFYEKHGGKTHKEEIIEIGGQSYCEIAYVFEAK